MTTLTSLRSVPALYTTEGLTRLTKIISSHGGLHNTAAELRLYPSSLEKILRNERVSYNTLNKLKTIIGPFCGPSSHTTYLLRRITSTLRGTPTRPTTDKLLRVHALFLQHGSLAAAGKHLGITRERTRQLLVIGHHRGLFTYTRIRLPTTRATKDARR